MASSTHPNSRQWISHLSAKTNSSSSIAASLKSGTFSTTPTSAGGQQKNLIRYVPSTKDVSYSTNTLNADVHQRRFGHPCRNLKRHHLANPTNATRRPNMRHRKHSYRNATHRHSIISTSQSPRPLLLPNTLRLVHRLSSAYLFRRRKRSPFQHTSHHHL